MGKNPKLIIKNAINQVLRFQTKSGITKARLVWNGDFGKRATAHLQRAQAMLDSEVMKQMEPYMQLDSGAMIKSMEIRTDVGSGEVVVDTPYARRVFYSSSSPGRPSGPLRGPRYFDRMKADKKEYFRKFAQRAVGIK